MKQLLGATIDMNIVVDFIMREMTPEDIRQIPLGKSTLYRLKSSTKEIEKANIKTIYTIQTYALEKKERIKEELALAESEPHSETRTRFIGLDIGTSHLVSASDIDMKDTYTCHRQGVKNCIRSYNARMGKRPNKQQKKRYKEELIKGLENQITKTINELIRHYGNNVIYVIGRTSIRSESTFKTVHKTFVRILNQLIRENDLIASVAMINEHFTSITCPKCNYSSSLNRTSTNEFECEKCHFKHDNDDEVASCNIAKKYLTSI